MISPYGDEPSDDEINQAYDEAEYYVSTELIDQTDQDSITNLRYETERYLEQIGLGGIIDTETMDQIIKKVYPAVELDNLKIDLAKDPALKTRFGNDPKAVIQKYQKRDS